MHTLLLATQNEKKGKELAELSRDRFLVRTLKDVGLADIHIVEDGATFAANARIKAEAVCAALAEGVRRETFAVLADDSGLVVDALDGRPGVRSARFAADAGVAFAGVSAADEANNALLLALLEPVPHERRGARFACAVCALIVGPSSARKSDAIEAFGTVEGKIARARAGTGGFGYDPLFLPDAFPGRALAEVSAAEKHAVSHRGHAMRAVLAELERRAVFQRATPR